MFRYIIVFDGRDRGTGSLRDRGTGSLSRELY